MWRLSHLRAMFHLLFRGGEVEDEMDEELRFHLDMQIQQNIEKGMTPEVARKEALRVFGGFEQHKEDCRDALGVRMFNDLLQDLRFGWRQICKNKSLSTVIVLTIGVCISVNVLIFGILDSLFFNPNLYPNEDRIVRISDILQNHNASNEGHWFTSPLHYLERIEQSNLVESIGFYQGRWGTLTEPTNRPNPQYTFYYRISPSLMKVLGVEAVLGRSIVEEDIMPGSNRVVVLSYEFWQSRYDGKIDVIGDLIEFAGTQSEGTRETYEIVGVMPKGFVLPSTFDTSDLERRRADPIFIPWIEQDWHRTSRGRLFYYGGSLALMKPGVTITQLHTELKAIADHNGPLYPDAYEHEQTNGHEIRILSLRNDLVRNSRVELLLLIVTSITLLVMGCINVASLVLSHNRKRMHELVIRSTLGASRKRLSIQIITESCLYALMGGVVGLYLYSLFFSVVSHFGVFEIFLVDPKLRFNWQLVLFVFILSGIAGVLIGVVSIIPVFWRKRLSLTMNESVRTTTLGKGFKHYQGVLICTQIILTCVVLIFGGLLLKSFVNILHTDPGFDPKNVFTASFRLSNNDYDRSAKRTFMSELRRKVQSIPGVASVGLNYYPPLKWGGNSIIHVISEQSWIAGVRETTSEILDSVDTGLFETLSIPLLRGRNFDQADLENLSRLLIIDQKTARTLFREIDPVGERIAVGWSHDLLDNIDTRSWYTIIGVVDDVKRTHLLDPSTMGTVYFHCYDHIPVWISLVVKSEGEVDELLDPIREVLADLDPRVAIARPETMEAILSKNYKNHESFFFVIMGIALLVLSLCTIGLSGVVNYLIVCQRKEIGIKMVLGAPVYQVWWDIVRYWMKICCVGILCGLAIALALIPHFKALLFEVTPYDPATLVITSLFLGCVVFLSAGISAKQATKIDPVEALRLE